MIWEKKIASEIRKIKESGHYRSRKAGISESDVLVNFSSNDYLSLSHDPRVSSAYQKGYQLYASGSGGSMLLNGYQRIHQSTETSFAQFLAVDDAILLSSGYTANLAIMALLKHLGVYCLIDKGLHASFYDGLKLYRPEFARYRHNDMKDFLQKIKYSPKSSITITEGIFSMSGQQPHLSEMAKISPMEKGQLIVDEAHSIGVLGEEGRGAVNLHGLSQKSVPLRVIPLGKAFASQGAVIAGQRLWIEALVQVARSYIYSTGISPAIAYGLQHTLDILQKSEHRREKLRYLIHFFRQQIKESSLQWTDSISPIQQLKLGCAHKALWFSKALKKEGVFCLPVRPPTVHKRDTGLRIILNYHHRVEDIGLLFKTLHRIEHDYSF
ncbi:aminotransferase class I/II-fold pyridoxal phosphate-dependent enzyme [Legionella israelensis]|uniref:aminotransferase class I/II-fold pyridoxal phosphate-dependent enzyme n=1 Tax=Legionella israelensis TaxID=454 RepID=UPI00118045BB|nr:aminotransferase class I/II-fold pyridoxal phosphate-dependent enzyme [Legionella israelensis]QDP72702.1 aminotransferase class I/II-fold pyridoxal phosphate-dependent enzyme [Legionella israelensis]